MVFQLFKGSCNKRAVYVQFYCTFLKIYLILPLRQAIYFVDDINVRFYKRFIVEPYIVLIFQLSFIILVFLYEHKKLEVLALTILL
jgi:hypothetical protein